MPFLRLVTAGLQGPFRALAHRNFRLYFAGQAVSILGTWIQQVALSWLVYRITGSAALLGVTAFAGLSMLTKLYELTKKPALAQS